MKKRDEFALIRKIVMHCQQKSLLKGIYSAIAKISLYLLVYPLNKYDVHYLPK